MYQPHKADELVKLYSDKLIGQPINPSKEDSYLINVVKATPVAGGTWNVCCFSIEEEGEAKGEILIQRDLIRVLKDLGIPSPPTDF